MDATEVRKIVCRRCAAILDVGDRYCHCCGASTSGAASLPSIPAGEAPADSVSGPAKVSDNPWVVLAMLFLILGPFALPMLWRSRGFSPLWKVLLTILVASLTAVLVYLIWFVVAKMSTLLDLWRSLQE